MDMINISKFVEDNVSRWTFFDAVRWDFPALLATGLLLLFLWSMLMTQRRSDFDFADIYRDSRKGKASLTRVTAMGAFVVSTWIVMQDALGGQPNPQIFWGYLVGWSGAEVLKKMFDKWNGQLPFGK